MDYRRAEDLGESQGCSLGKKPERWNPGKEQETQSTVV